MLSMRLGLSTGLTAVIGVVWSGNIRKAKACLPRTVSARLGVRDLTAGTAALGSNADLPSRVDAADADGSALSRWRYRIPGLSRPPTCGARGEAGGAGASSELSSLWARVDAPCVGS